MRKYLFLLFIISSCLSLQSQNLSPWSIVDPVRISFIDKKVSSPNEDKQLLFRLDVNLLKQSLGLIANKASLKQNVEVVIPNKKGFLEKFTVREISNFEPELQARYPEIKAYEGAGVSDPGAYLCFSLSPKGIQTMVFRGNSGSEFIESYPEDESLYVLKTSENRSKGSLPFSCKTADVVLNKDLFKKTAKISANDKVFRTLRLALSCTGEYTSFHGGTVSGALAAMNATLTRVNAVFNRDLALRLILISNNTALIYTNASTDPYSDASIGVNGKWSEELQSNLTATIGNNNYDIGHLFGASGGGGNAGCIGCVCENPTVAEPLAKGSAYTSPSNGKPSGDSFDIDFVAHELGHQLGANHTFSYELEGTGVNVEPGSGSTIMGYAGITDDYDIQSDSDDYFAYASINQIQANLATKSCPVKTTISNNPPLINAGADYTIPKGTAFVLKGTGSDPDGDTLSFCWEQNDTATSASKESSFAVPTKNNGPLFRSLYPSSSPIRYMPLYGNVLANKLTSRWESVSDVSRTLHFVLTARDNASLGSGQTNSDEMIVNVSGTAGPFVLTSQNEENLGWMQGTNQVVTWSVNGTNSLQGSSNVNIKLSIDGGLTFSIVLASNVPNNGSATIKVPNIEAKKCRILIEPTDNIYYAINSRMFAIGYSVTTSCSDFVFPDTPFAVPEKAAYTVRTITYPASAGLISDVNFNLGFTHSYMSDLQMEVVSPQGTTVKLFDRSCSDTNGSVLLTYDDQGGDLMCGLTTKQTVSPFQPLSAFNGENPQGTWTFRIRDNYPSDTGTLNSASINICVQAFTLEKPIFKVLDFVMYPNPSDGNFNVYFVSDSTSTVKILIHDLLGRKVFENEYPKTFVFDEKIQLSSFQSGIYLMQVIVGDKKVIKKIVFD